MSTPVLACLVGREADRTGCCGGYTGRPLVLHATNKQHRLRPHSGVAQTPRVCCGTFARGLSSGAACCGCAAAPADRQTSESDVNLEPQRPGRVGSVHTGQVLLQATACGCSSARFSQKFPGIDRVDRANSSHFLPRVEGPWVC